MDVHSKETIPKFYNKHFFMCALQSGLRVADLNIISYKVEPSAAGGENYCSNIFRSYVQYDIGNGIEHIALIIKNLPDAKQGVLKNLNVFDKETIFYVDIMPRLETLMWCTKTSWKLGARHFYSIAYPEQSIVLEDLNQQGFALQSRQLGLDAAHTVQVLKKLAQYHASTIYFTFNDSKTVGDKFQYGILNTAAIKSPSFKVLFGAQLLKLASLTSEWDGFTNISRKLYKYHGSFTERLLKSVYPLEGSINVINHGDLWTNNLLFKETDVGNFNVKFIDFQLSFYGSLGFDLQYFFNTSVQWEVLQNRREELIETYFKSLSETLKKLTTDVEPPSLIQIENEIKKKESYGFFVAFGFLPLMAMDSMDSHDNSLKNLHDQDFARLKIELMFRNERLLTKLKYILLRANEMGILD